MPRSVVEHALLMFFVRYIAAFGRVDKEHRFRNATSFEQKTPASRLVEMAVEMCRHKAIELLRSERRLQCVGPKKCAARHSLASHRQHGRAMIQASDVSAQAGREE